MGRFISLRNFRELSFVDWLAVLGVCLQTVAVPSFIEGFALPVIGGDTAGPRPLILIFGFFMYVSTLHYVYGVISDTGKQTGAPLPKGWRLPLGIGTYPGFIYVMRRADGIYKVGRSHNPRQRLVAHTLDYGKEFQLIKRFVVPDSVIFEKLALRMTAEYYHKEAGRIELRKMTDAQLKDFMAEFEQLCREAVTR